MNYCARYDNNINLSGFDEISVRYIENKEGAFFQFLEKHPTQKITLIISDPSTDIDWSALNAYYQQYPNFSICFWDISKFQPFPSSIPEACAIPFYTGYLATNFEQLCYLCEKGVAEVYIGSELCFDLKCVKQQANQYNIKLRAFPNVAQSTVQATKPIKKFFIRPEDVSIYVPYIDTLEFFGDNKRQEALLRIYQSGIWSNNLNALIIDFPTSLDSRHILPSFAQMRLSCAHKCFKGSRCSICDRSLNIAKNLKEQQLFIKTTKEN